MPETGHVARRRSALATPPNGPIRLCAPATRLSLRFRATGGTPSIDGLPLDLPINRCASAGGRLVSRLGPDEWLILASEDETETLPAKISAAFDGRFHTLVDISHRQVGLTVQGGSAADILNAGCPLDLHPSAFPPGFATRTLLGKAEIVLMLPSEPAMFRVECARSFADYTLAFLTQAARDV